MFSRCMNDSEAFRVLKLQDIYSTRLACPLVDWLVAPISFGKSWSKFGISKSKIIHYDGLEEAAWLKDSQVKTPKVS